MLSSFGMDFALNFGVKEKKKASLLKNLRLLDHVRLICLNILQKSVCGDLFLGKSLVVLLCYSAKVYSRLGALAVILGARQEIPPVHKRSQDF